MKNISAMFIFFLFYTCSGCANLNIQKKNSHLISGRWISAQDSLSVLQVKEDSISQFYNGRRIYSLKYQLISKSCDTLYKTNSKHPIFLKLGNYLCYEVIEITDEYIEILYTANGQISTFWRQK